MKDELTDIDIKKLIDNLYEKHIYNLSLGGGEPFLRNVIQIFDYMSGKLNTSVTTNGTIMNDELIRCFLRNRIKITISLDSLSDEISTKIRRGICTEHVIRNIMKLVQHDEIRERLSIRTTVSTYNMSELIRIVEFCNENKIPVLKINSTNYFGRARERSDVIPEFDCFLEKLYEVRCYCQEYQLYTRVELPIEKYLTNEKRQCTLGKDSLYIDASGECYPCAFTEGNLSFGNIREVPWETLLVRSQLFNHENSICNCCPIHRYEITTKKTR